MNTKNKTPTKSHAEIERDCLKLAIIDLRMAIRDLKEKKQVSDVEILRYVYKRLNELLNI